MSKPCRKQMRLHPGPRIDRIPVKGAAGLLFVVGTLAIFLLGVPETRLFLLITLPAGVIGAAILYYIRHR